MVEGLPNVHPLLVHFPIALLVTAVVADVVALVAKGNPLLRHLATGLYVSGSVMLVASYFTGQSASATVRVPGMAHAVLNEHWTWALRTTVYFGGVALGRLCLIPAPRVWQGRLSLALVLAGVLGLGLVVRTAELGGRMVYTHGVGVAAPY